MLVALTFIKKQKKTPKITTTRDKSATDFVTGGTEMMPWLSNFKVCDFDPLLSDIHCPLSVQAWMQKWLLSYNHNYFHGHFCILHSYSCLITLQWMLLALDMCLEDILDYLT